LALALALALTTPSNGHRQSVLPNCSRTAAAPFHSCPSLVAHQFQDLVSGGGRMHVDVDVDVDFKGGDGGWWAWKLVGGCRE